MSYGTVGGLTQDTYRDFFLARDGKDTVVFTAANVGTANNIHVIVEGDTGPGSSYGVRDFSTATALQAVATMVPQQGIVVRIDDARQNHYRCRVKSAATGLRSPYRVFGESDSTISVWPDH